MQSLSAIASTCEHLILVGCSTVKLPHAAPAKELYCSDLFRKARRYAELYGDRWMILSSEHGLLDPEQVIVPYDNFLKTQSRAQRAAWDQKVTQQLRSLCAGRQVRLTALAGLGYLGWARNFEVAQPLAKLEIGDRLRWLKLRTQTAPAPDSGHVLAQVST